MSRKTTHIRVYKDDAKYLRNFARILKDEFNNEKIGIPSIIKRMVNKEKRKKKFEL